MWPLPLRPSPSSPPVSHRSQALVQSEPHPSSKCSRSHLLSGSLWYLNRLLCAQVLKLRSQIHLPPHPIHPNAWFSKQPKHAGAVAHEKFHLECVLDLHYGRRTPALGTEEFVFRPSFCPYARRHVGKSACQILIHFTAMVVRREVRKSRSQWSLRQMQARGIL
jgi:hypothetical protein